MMYLGKDPVGLATSIPEFANIAKIEVGRYIPTEDITVSNLWIQHSLGVEPDFILYQSNITSSTSNLSGTNLILGTVIKTDMLNQYNG